MAIFVQQIKCVVAALFIVAAFPVTLFAQTEKLDELFVQLRAPDLENWESVEQEIWKEWSKSGSPAMDMLLERGREAMAEADFDSAIGHLTALTDHAPEFAEGYNARATAYFQADLYGPSIRDIEMTLALNPRHFGALSGLGMILEQLGLYQDALTAYQAVIAIHPHRPNVKEAVERLEGKVGGTDI